MPFWLSNILLPLIRWLHIVGATLLLGGTFFFEFAVPEALEDLKPEHRMGVVGRFRWIFRRVVVVSCVFLALSGGIASLGLWRLYHSVYEPAKLWWALHVGLGVITMALALRLTLFGRVPPHTQGWMRFNVVLLLVVVFLAALSRHVRLVLDETHAIHNPRVHVYDLHRRQ